MERRRSQGARVGRPVRARRTDRRGSETKIGRTVKRQTLSLHTLVQFRRWRDNINPYLIPAVKYRVSCLAEYSGFSNKVLAVTTVHTPSQHLSIRISLGDCSRDIHYRYFAIARYRNVTICPRVQMVSGLKVVALVPAVTPFSIAHATACV